jgi:uncharacterized protein YndB with AHSA1/START domain
MDGMMPAIFHARPGGDAVELSRFLRHPPEKVWAALTIPARLAAWMGIEWLGPDEALRTGAEMHYRFTNMDMETRGTVLRCEPPALLEHSFSDHFPPGAIVTWSLAPEADGTRLTLTHRFRGPEDAPRTAAGWASLLGQLDAALGGHTPQGGMEEWRRWRDDFAASFPPAAIRDGRSMTEDGFPALRFERVMAHPPEKIWSALVEPDAIARWWQAEATVEPRLGGKFSLIFQGGPHRMNGEITRWEPPSVLEYTWPETHANGDSLVRWTLRPDVAGCRLTLTHVLRAGGNAADFASGWHWHLDAMDRALLGETVSFDEPRWKTLRKIYQATL